MSRLSFSVEAIMADRHGSIGSPTSSEGSQSPPHCQPTQQMPDACKCLRNNYIS